MSSEFHDELAFMSRNVEWHLGIGDVATATGVSQSQLRYWEQKGYITSAKENGQNRKYTYATLIKVFVIKRHMEQGFTLAAAAKKADQRKEAIDVIKHAIVDRFQGIDQIDGYPAVNLGYLNENQNEVLYAVVKEDHTDLKLIPRDK
ncbi:MerR family transcriptional regulator [Secundilactobacillus muriivasis]